jgi:hypothetical protein
LKKWRKKMDKIQLIFFFVSGFLVSRLIIKVQLPHRIVYWFKCFFSDSS